ncbi:hypothetical protein [Dyadobacter luticola]|uniref:Glycosyltransferase family 4 protein n=1 Tax=Dyadobacter luticola TaxID=1979387 RepID=A0A5R9KWV7_9BACT|nr:hypothetical protein [Dyadobacter luticola]TLV00782.1 hypothetical protein FEN17_14995 [Dyadobacter luticola]
MIYVTDVASVDVQHEQFNRSFLQLLPIAYPQEQIQFYGEATHIQNLDSDTRNIAFNQIPVYNKRGGLKEFIRAYHQFKALSKVIQLARKNRAKLVVVLLIHPLAHFLFKLFGSKKVAVSIVMHGELESVKFNKHFLNKIWGFFQKIALTKVSPNVSYIILGQSIYKNLINVLPEFSKQSAVVLDHPYPFTSQTKSEKDFNFLTFATLGVATKAKNTHYFFNLAEESNKKGLPYKFNICGRVYKNMLPYLNAFVNYKKDFGSFTRKELDSLIRESHFTVFYYENSDYSLCASGSFWDTVNAEIPLLFVRNDYFNFYTSIAGQVGYSFETPEELNAFILNADKDELIKGDDYPMFVANIRKLKYEYMGAENLAYQLKSLIKG